MSLKRNALLLTFAITAALVGAAFFCPKTCAAQGQKLIFTFQDKVFEYDPAAFAYDPRDRDGVSSLMRRGFFDDAKTRLDVINEAMGLGFDEKTAVCYVLAGFEKTLDEIKRAVQIEKTDSVVMFNARAKDPFCFTTGKDGRKVDEKKLFLAVIDSLKTGRTEIKVPTYCDKAVSAEENKKNTSLKAKFATDYSNSSADRKSNVRLALSKFNGLVVPDGAEVSFNAVVGRRTKENGFKNAKVILDGQYTDGIGGGVCQASTTLYNAALLAGLKIKEWHRHTLKSSYVMPSFDAMVNDNGADLVFLNDSGKTLYLKTVCDDASAAVYIFGAPNEFEIKRVSRVTGKIKAKIAVSEDKEGRYAIYDDEQVLLRSPADGVSSAGYLVYKKGGKEAKRELIRKDTYKKTDGLAVRGVKKRRIAAENDEKSIMHNAAPAA